MSTPLQLAGDQEIRDQSPPRRSRAGARTSAADVKRDRFLRVAEKRVNAVLLKLRVLSNCSNRAAYTYSPEDVDKIRSAIQDQLDRTIARFEGGKRVQFKL